MVGGYIVEQPVGQLPLPAQGHMLLSPAGQLPPPVGVVPQHVWCSRVPPAPLGPPLVVARFAALDYQAVRVGEEPTVSAIADPYCGGGPANHEEG